MISSSLSRSKRLSGLPTERAALLYVFLVSRADAYGRAEVDPISLLDIGGRWGITHGWTQETVNGDVALLADAGLVRLWGEAPDLYAEVVKFSVHNKTRPEREAPTKVPAPPWSNSGSTPDLLRTNSRTIEEKRSIREGEVERPAGAARASAAPPVSTKEDTHRPRRLLAALGEWAEKTGRIQLPPNPGERKVIEDAEADGFLDRWPTQEALVGEIARTFDGMTRKNLPVSTRTLVSHLGETWEERGRNGRPAAPVADGVPGVEETRQYIEDTFRGGADADW